MPVVVAAAAASKVSAEPASRDHQGQDEEVISKTVQELA